MNQYLAVDLGAESGRVILGTLENGKLRLGELHRFPNAINRASGSLTWNIDALWKEIQTGLAKAKAFAPQSVGVDSWALDYVLMKDGHRLDREPRCYRDPRTDLPFQQVRAQLGEERIYSETGIQFMPINTLYHLIADRDATDQPLKDADQFLMIGDWFHYLLSGNAVQEESNASTTQLWNTRKRAWASDLIKELGIGEKFFPQGVPPCTRLGTLLPEIQQSTGLGSIDVVAGCVHDTGAAVAAVPASGNDWAYLSSGTWSLIGVELPEPLINEAARKANFTNETGVNGTSRFLKNASGMWLIQESRRAWAAEGRDYSYADLAQMAQEAGPARAWINPDAADFLRPENMPAAIREACRKSGQPVPETDAQIVRVIVESLALLYEALLAQVEELTGRTIKTLHVVGGGSQNTLLNQFTANASGRTVVSGPVEATAIGNLLLQALTLGHIGSLENLRSVVRASFPLQTFQPKDSDRLAEAKIKFQALRAC